MSPRWAVAGVLFAAACSSSVPKELVNARSAYNAMNAGPARASASSEADRAREALARAEQSYRDDGASKRTRELAANAEREAMNAQQVCMTGMPGTASMEMTPEVAQARLTAVINEVPNTVMFEFDKSELTPAAKTRLDDLAQALTVVRKHDTDKTIMVKGYADAVGEEEYNRSLSERRAHAVRDYLSSRGYDPNLVQVRALGEVQPVATNATAQGRAENRRVEILLQPKKTDE